MASVGSFGVKGKKSVKMSMPMVLPSLVGFFHRMYGELRWCVRVIPRVKCVMAVAYRASLGCGTLVGRYNIIYMYNKYMFIFNQSYDYILR